MGRFMLYLGLALLALPFMVMGVEMLYARLAGLTGEARMAAGFWGVWIGFITVIPGLVLTVLGLLATLLGRD